MKVLVQNARLNELYILESNGFAEITTLTKAKKFIDGVHIPNKQKFKWCEGVGNISAMMNTAYEWGSVIAIAKAEHVFTFQKLNLHGGNLK